MIERIHLAILVAVSEQGSLTAAADKLCLTQSALSHSIKKLEQQLGLDLWLKKGRNIQLTQAGEYLLHHAQRLLPQLQYLDRRMGEFSRGEGGTLRIGMECHPCYRWLMKVVNPFLNTYEKVDVDVKQKFQFGGLAALFNHEIDMLVTPDPLFQPNVQFIPVFQYQQELVVSEKNPLSDLPWVSPEQLKDQVLYSYPVEKERLDIYSEFLTPANCRPKAHKSIEATDMLMQLVAANRGIAALPGWLIREYQKELPIKSIKLGASGISKSIYLGIREQDSYTPLIATFLELALTAPDPAVE